jgi:diguanylate cyclase (GGDEF)-like protein/PAS domain S-box-containing protein
MDQHHSDTRRDSVGLWDWNLASNRIHFSPRWISLVGCEDHEVGNTLEEWTQRVHPDDLGHVLREIEAAQAEGSCELDFRHRLRHKDGAYRWMSCRGVVMRNEGGKVIRLTGSHSDITVETVTDPLTGLPNRLLLLDRLTRSIERTNRYQGFHFAVLLLDLGRPVGPLESAAGDPLLTAVARRLETCLRIGDETPNLRHNDLVARLQCDQFAILLDGLKDVSHAKVVADRILVEILAKFTLSGREIRLPASLGIAVSATGYTRPDDVLRDAETALHRARVLGGSHCEFFDTAILQSEQAELQLEGDLKEALERREFQLFYQPIVSLVSNEILGFEALVRWQHSVLGMIPPLDFIPFAEKTGFIVPLGNWILREACLRLRAWQDSLPRSTDVWMSVNLSSVQLRHPALFEQIEEALRDSGLDARSLVLELTEGIAMENPTSVKTLLMQLRAMGIRISIDDFGTGYSSLAYLRQFPVDSLKVDRSFVRGMETNKDMADIIGTMTVMAQQLGLHVVAEGVENEEQVVLLRRLHCESAQGYLFAKPLDVNRATDLLKTGLPPRSGSAGDKEPATSLRPESPMPKPRDGRRLSPIRRWLPIAAAALLALMTCAGLVARFTNGPRPAALSSSPLPLENADQGPRLGMLADARVPIQTSDTVTVTAAPAASSVRRKEDLSAASSAQHPAVVTLDATAPPVLGRSRASAPETPGPAVRKPTSLNVVHLHRVGSCQGRLVVSWTGVAFVPDEKTSKEAFALKYSDFLYTLEDSRLTIKTNDRTYRFKAATVAGKDDDGPQLHDAVESIARFR